MNSICPSAVTVANSSRANKPFSPTSMYAPSSASPVSCQPVAPGRNAAATGSGAGQSTRGIGLPLRRTGPPQRLDHDLHVANELRHGECQQVLLDVGGGDGPGVRRVEEVAGALELVLVGERGGGVDAVHDGVRAVAIEDLEHEAALQHV